MVLPPIDTLAMTLLLLVVPVLLGDVEELLPPPPHALMPAISVAANNRRARPDLGGRVMGIVTALPPGTNIMLLDGRVFS